MTNAEKYKTVNERVVAFWNNCKTKCSRDEICERENIFACAFRWLDLPVEEDFAADEEEKPMPCPFCGSDMDIPCDDILCCNGCGYLAPNHAGLDSIETQIAYHNSICRQLAVARKSEEGNDQPPL